MKTLYTKTLLLVAVLFLGTNLMTAENILATSTTIESKILDDDKPKTNKYVQSKKIENASEFNLKVNNALEVLRSGYGKEVNVNSCGANINYDFKKENNFARLIVNSEEGVLKLVQHQIEK